MTDYQTDGVRCPAEFDPPGRSVGQPFDWERRFGTPTEFGRLALAA